MPVFGNIFADWNLKDCGAEKFVGQSRRHVMKGTALMKIMRAVSCGT